MTIIQQIAIKEVFEVIGGGKYGRKNNCYSKEKADHNLKYMIAAALLDGNVLPRQYNEERINRPAVQELLQKVNIKPDDTYTELYPETMGADVVIILQSGQQIIEKKGSYEGQYTHTMSWDRVVEKFSFLSEPHSTNELQEKIVSVVDNMESINIADLTALLAEVSL